jgi:flagellar hook-associated protein FlgK
LNALAQWITSQNIQGISATVVNDGLRLSASDNHREIRLGLAATGTPADLTSLGFDTSVYLAGTAKDDLLVFVADPITGTADLPNASITSQYDGVVGDMKQILREQSLEVSFLDDGRYVIKDTRSDTVLAQRTLDTQAGTPVIRYRGLTLEFSTTPEMDDVFRIDGNQDGIGNNEAMLKLADLENSKIMPGGLTLTEAYIERVNQVGNVARQAAISKQALTVVNEQAQKARDGVSGVSLDEEAGELVRFQQAYQANAKVMQVASQLFEAILQVR